MWSSVNLLIQLIQYYQDQCQIISMISLFLSLISQCLSLAIFLFSPCASSISSININIKHKQLLTSVQQKSSSTKVPKTPQHMWWRPVIFRLLAGNFTKTRHNYQRILFFQFFKEILSRDQNTPCTTVCNHASNLYTWLQLSTQLFFITAVKKRMRPEWLLISIPKWKWNYNLKKHETLVSFLNNLWSLYFHMLKPLVFLCDWIKFICN